MQVDLTAQRLALILMVWGGLGLFFPSLTLVGKYDQRRYDPNSGFQRIGGFVRAVALMGFGVWLYRL